MKPVSVLGRFLETVNRWELLPRGCRVLVAVSGGPDSVCLLDLLRAVARRFELKLCAFHMNHRLRPTAERDEGFVRKLCADWDVPLTVVRSDVAAYARRHRLGLEEAGRELRYHHLARIAKRLGCDRIALGHTADDNLETIILNLARGAGLRGLSGIPVVRDNFIRPLLDLERNEILSHLRARGIEWVEDESNKDPRFRRNLVRQELVPLLKRLSPAAVQNARRAATLLADDDRLLETIAASEVGKVVVSRRPAISIDTREFAQYNISLKRRILRQLFPELNSNDVERIISLTQNRSSGRLVLRAGIEARLENGLLRLSRPRRGGKRG
ncbi:MAG: tRNA lysidine(34) synthetase TilS [candidate division WOR-3 bacterium]